MSDNTPSDDELTNSIVGSWHVPLDKELSVQATFKSDGTLRLIGFTKDMSQKYLFLI